MDTDPKFAKDIAPPTSAPPSDELYPLDVLIILAKRKKMIAYFTLGITLLAAIVSLLIPKTFTATTRVLPPQQSQSSAFAMLAQMNPLAASLGRDLGLKNPGDLYVAMIKSRTVADNLINQFDLRKVYDKKTYEDARKKLANRSDVRATKEGIIEISVDDREPGRAAQVANAYVVELQKLSQSLAVTEASQRRLFFEQQLVSAKDSLTEAEVALKETQEKTGLIQLDGQAKAIIESAAVLRAQIAAKEIQLQRMRLFATPQNPDLQGTEQELSGLRAQLSIVERKAGGGNGDIQVATSRVPAAGLEFIRRLRDVKYRETMFELLAKQFEAAKLDEAKNSAVIQVLDIAVEPEQKSQPKRWLIVLISAFVSFLLSIIGALAQESFERLRSDPEGATRLLLFREYLTRRG